MGDFSMFWSLEFIFYWWLFVWNEATQCLRVIWIPPSFSFAFCGVVNGPVVCSRGVSLSINQIPSTEVNSQHSKWRYTSVPNARWHMFSAYGSQNSLKICKLYVFNRVFNRIFLCVSQTVNMYAVHLAHVYIQSPQQVRDVWNHHFTKELMGAEILSGLKQGKKIKVSPWTGIGNENGSGGFNVFS